MDDWSDVILEIRCSNKSLFGGADRETVDQKGNPICGVGINFSK